MDWNDLRYFLAVARGQSLSEAARVLRVSPATVSRRIAALEAALDAKLFVKRPSGYSLTTAGAAIMPRAEQAEAQLSLLERVGASPASSLEGVVRLAVPELLGQHLLIPSLKSFFEIYPGIKVDINADVRSINLVRRPADIVVRLIRPARGDYRVRRVGSISLALYGSVEYFSSRPTPETPSDLGEHRLIGWETDLDQMPLSRWLFDSAPQQSIIFRAHTMSTHLAAVEAGIGLAVLPSFIAEKRGLIDALPTQAPYVSDIWLLQASDVDQLPRVAALSTHIARVLGAASATLCPSR